MDGAQSFIRNGRAQNDLDMNSFKLLNLDTSNLPPVGIPPTINPPDNQWLHAWDSTAQEWTATQPRFLDLSGNLTNSQMLAITRVGTVSVGTWRATPLEALYVPTLNGIRAPTGNVSLNNKRLTDVADPVDDQDAVNKRFMDLLLLGLNPKEAVKVTQTIRLPLAGLYVLDGVQLLEDDRVLVNRLDRSDPDDNGIYIASTGVWTRSEDCDEADELNRAYCFVLEGDVYGGTSWVQVEEVVNVGSDNIIFVLFSSGGSIQPGDGLELDGNTLNVLGTTDRILVGATVDIDPAYEGQTSITKLGTIDTGTWEGETLMPAYGGTGKNNSFFTLELAVDVRVVDLGFIPLPGLELQVNGPTTVKLPSVGTLATLAGNETLAGKRITKRSFSTASTAVPAINTDATDSFMITALATNISSFTTGMTGTPDHGDELEIWIQDNGMGHTIVWGSMWIESPDLTLPLITQVTGWLYMRFVFNSQAVAAPTPGRWVLTVKLEGIS